MGLESFLDNKQALGEKYEKFLKLKEQFIKEGLPENIAIYKASWILTPQKLEKIKLYVSNEEGLRTEVAFFFDSVEDLKLLSKYFTFNANTKQVKDARLLIELLKVLESL